MTAVLAQGTIVAYENPAATWNTIPDVGDFELPSESAEDIDVTTHSSADARKEYIAGLIDSDEMSLPLKYDPDEQHHNYFRDNIGTTVNLRVTWKNASTTTFEAIIKGFTRSAPVNDAYMATITFRKTGAFTEA